MRLTDRQQEGLVLLYERALAHEATNPKLCWAGSREGITGTTIEALARRGLAKAQWVEKPYARIMGRITSDGAAYARENLGVAAMRER